MSSTKEKPPPLQDDTKRIRVSKNGSYIVSGGIPLKIKEIRNDAEGYCSTWHDVKTFPLQEQYALCRCGQSKKNLSAMVPMQKSTSTVPKQLTMSHISTGQTGLTGPPWC